METRGLFDQRHVLDVNLPLILPLIFQKYWDEKNGNVN